MSYVYNKIYEDVLNYYENYGFDTQEEAEEWLSLNLTDCEVDREESAK